VIAVLRKDNTIASFTIARNVPGFSTSFKILSATCVSRVFLELLLCKFRKLA